MKDGLVTGVTFSYDDGSGNQASLGTATAPDGSGNWTVSATRPPDPPARKLQPRPGMYLVHILLPLADNDGRLLARELFRAVATELTERFGGLTAHTRAPAEGLWRDDGDARTTRDEIVIYEVMARELDEAWWAAYRRTLEARFRQEQVVVRAQEIRLL